MKLALLLSAALAAGACSSERPHITTAARPPLTRIAAVTETLHGVEVADNYRWLEGDNSDPNNLGKLTPEVTAWTEAQNTYTRAVLDHLPGRKALEDGLRPLMRIGSVTEPIMRGNRYFYASRVATKDQPVVYWREGSLGAERVLLDPAEIDSSGSTAVAWFSPSEDGKLLAYGAYNARSGATTLRLIDVDSKKPFPLEIESTPQGVQWLPDASGFVYQQLRNPSDSSSAQGRFHRMGTPPATDAVLYRGPFGRLSRDGRWLLLGFGTGPASNDLWLASFDSFRKTGKLVLKPVSVGGAGQTGGTVIADTVFLHTTKGAPNGRVVAVGAAAPAEAHWREIIAERPDAVIENVAFARGAIAVTYRKNASNVIEVFDVGGKSLGHLSQPGIGASGITASEDRTEAYLTFASFNHPPTIFRVELTTPGAAPKRWMTSEVPVDASSVGVEQVWYPSKDGTQISMFLVHKKGAARTGDTPTILAGHGGFGASLTPTFSATLFQWFEAGGLFAVPNLRGGGEYGAGWHAAGRRDKKQNAVDDVLAAAEWLIANKYTNPAKLALYGGAHGGLLVGAAITQRSDRFRAAVLLLPVLDMLRYQHFLMGRYWVPEYGSAGDATEFTWLVGYSPYHHVKAGTRYPAVLLTALEQDAPVHALHARKMAAALQAATGSDPAEQPILLRVDLNARAGPETLRTLLLRDIVDQRIFLMWQLGMLTPF